MRARYVRTGTIVCTLAAMTFSHARAASAQPPAGPGQTPGWVLTPSAVYSGGWDDNVLVKGEGDETPGDVLNMLNGRAGIDYTGRRGQFGADYNGAFLLYRDLGSLNSYDQRTSVSARRLVSRHVTIFARNSFAAVPTTQSVELVGVPFVRTGSRIDDLQSGVEAALSKRTTMSAVYSFQWVAFDEDPTLTTVLQGGHNHQGSVSFRHVLSRHVTGVANYALQFARVSETGETFTIHNADAGVEYQLSEAVRIHAAGGVSRLNVTSLGFARVAPSVRAGISRQFAAAVAGASYGRSFIPSYGFGGSSENEELEGHVHLPLSRRMYQQSSVTWRRNEPLTLGQPSLRSFWIEAVIGYSVRPSVHVEGFYAGAHQSIDRAGGVTNRNRIGFQIVTSKPVRVR